MKQIIVGAVVAVVAAMSVSPSALSAACSGGGGSPGGSDPSGSVNAPYPTRPAEHVTHPATSMNRISLKRLSPAAPVAPQARISVVAAGGTPVGRLQIATPAAAVEKPALPVAPQSAIKTDSSVAATAAAHDTKINDATDSTVADKEQATKINEALKGLVGQWMAVSRTGDGALSTVELRLDDNGWAKLTVPGADGQPSTTTRKVEFENNELKLIGGGADVLLGKLVEFNSRQLVLERSGGQVTFVRP